MFLSKEDVLKIGFKSVGDNVLISDKCVIYGAERIEIGNNVRIDSQCILIAGKDTKIIIGNNIHISAGCYYYAKSGNIILEDCTTTSAGVVLYTATDDYTEGYMTNPMIS